jgi:hypothetical protein
MFHLLSSFAFSGHNSFFLTAFIGDVNGTVSAQDTFARSPDGRWLISQEIWNFTSYNSGWPILVKNR